MDSLFTYCTTVTVIQFILNGEKRKIYNVYIEFGEQKERKWLTGSDEYTSVNWFGDKRDLVTHLIYFPSKIAIEFDIIFFFNIILPVKIAE